MIEQTGMTVTAWNFHLSNISNNLHELSNTTTLYIMQKRNALKKCLLVMFVLLAY